MCNPRPTFQLSADVELEVTILATVRQAAKSLLTRLAPNEAQIQMAVGLLTLQGFKRVPTEGYHEFLHFYKGSYDSASKGNTGAKPLHVFTRNEIEGQGENWVAIMERPGFRNPVVVLGKTLHGQYVDRTMSFGSSSLGQFIGLPQETDRLAFLEAQRTGTIAHKKKALAIKL